MKSISNFITEKLHLRPDISINSGFYDVLEYLDDVIFKSWEYKHYVSDKPKESNNSVDIIFNCKISDVKASKLCAELNANLKWSKYDNYTARWGNSSSQKKFTIVLYEKSK